MAQSEHGFGAPTTWLDVPPGYVAEQYDAGFGSPTNLDQWGDIDLALYFGDTEFGSPLTIILAVADPSDVRDDGGQIVRGIADWPIVGPYQVELVDAAGTSYACYGVRPGEGQEAGDCYTDNARERLTFATPPAPIGTYDLRISWVDGTQQSSTIEDALQVHYRGRFAMVYEVRSRFPSRAYYTGRRSLSAEDVLGA